MVLASSVVEAALVVVVVVEGKRTSVGTMASAQVLVGWAGSWECSHITMDHR
jgi:hypothetical protein